MKYYDILYFNYDLEIIEPDYKENATAVAAAATAEELEEARSAMFSDYHRIIDDIATLQAEIDEKRKILRANDEIERIIKRELEKREAAEA